MSGQQRLGTKQSKGGRFKKLVAGGLALGAVALGIKADHDVKKQSKEELSAHLAGISTLQTPSGLAGFSSEGVMSGTQKPAQGIKGGDPTKFKGGGTALDTTPAGSGKKQGLQQAITSGAGLIAGQTSLESAVKDLAGAVFEGRKDPTAEQLSAAGRGAKAGASVVAGAEGVKASNKELLGQLAGKLKPKKPKRFAG